VTAPTTAPAEAQRTNAHIDPAAQVQGAGFVPVQTRSERPHSFEPADFGAPSGREVNWKHTPVAKLAPLFAVAENNDGVSYTFRSGEQYVAPSLAATDAPRGEVFLAEDVTAAVAWQGSKDALHIRIPREEEVAEPILLEIAGLGADRRADAHIVIEALEHLGHGGAPAHRRRAVRAERRDHRP